MTQPDGAADKDRPLLVRLLPLAVLAGGTPLFFALDLDRFFAFEVLRDNRQALTDWVAAMGWIAGLVFLLFYAAVVAFSLPAGSLMTVLGGFLFGTLAATFYVVIGATLGASAIFLAAKTALGESLRRRLGPGFERIEAGFNRDAFSYLLFLRLVPLFPFFLVNLAPAFMGIRLRTYFLTTLIGIIPGTFVFASIGNGLGAIFDAGEVPDLSILWEPDILIPLVGLAILALVPILYRKIKGEGPAQAVETGSGEGDV